MDKTVVPVALITGIVVLTLALIAPRMAEPGDIPIRPTSFFFILLMLIFVPIGLAGLFLINQYASDPLNDLFKNGSKSLLILIALIFCVFLLVTLVCMAVHPTDGFLDAGVSTLSKSSSGTDPLIARIADSEARTCALMTRTDKFIRGAVGPKGMKTNAEGDTEETPVNRAYVKEAQMKARAAVPGGTINCENPSTVTDTGARISILNNTLRYFVGANIVSNYDATVNSKIACKKTLIPCFDVKNVKQEDILMKLARFDQKTMLWNQSNPTLETAESAISCYESNILAPMDALTDRLQKGELLDCERKNATS